jgi:septum site-determining protein MinD
MPGYVCTFAGGKGGTGKTTTAVNVAAALQSMGYDTVVLDTDLGMSNLGAMLDVEVETSIHDLLRGGHAVSDALVRTESGFTVVPGAQSIDAFVEADPERLRSVLGTLHNAYNVILIDNGAGLSHETTVPLQLADDVVVVTTPDDVAMDDAAKTVEFAQRLDTNVLGTVATRLRKPGDVPRLGLNFDVPLLGGVPEDGPATSDEPLVTHSPRRPAAEAYRQLTDALESIWFGDADAEDVAPVFDHDWLSEEYSPDLGAHVIDDDVSRDNLTDDRARADQGAMGLLDSVSWLRD